MDDTISDNDISIDNYSIVRKDRNRNGEGVCVFVRSDINYTVKNGSDNVDDIEVTLLEICLPKTKPLLLGVCYRPPDCNAFYDSLEALLNKSVGTDTECILIGI